MFEQPPVKRFWYYIALYLPLLVPAVYLSAAALIVCITQLVTGEDGYYFSDDIISALLLMQVRLAGIPYLLFTLFVLLWGRGKSEKQLVAAGRSLPWLFLIYYIFFRIVGSYAYQHQPQGLPELTMFFEIVLCFLIIIFAYFYVFLGNALIELVREDTPHKDPTD